MALKRTKIQKHTEAVVLAKNRLLILTSLIKLKFHIPNFKNNLLECVAWYFVNCFLSGSDYSDSGCMSVD